MARLLHGELPVLQACLGNHLLLFVGTSRLRHIRLKTGQIVSAFCGRSSGTLFSLSVGGQGILLRTGFAVLVLLLLLLPGRKLLRLARLRCLFGLGPISE